MSLMWAKFPLENVKPLASSLPLHRALVGGSWMQMSTRCFAELWPGWHTQTLRLLIGCQRAAELELGLKLRQELEREQGLQTELRLAT